MTGQGDGRAEHQGAGADGGGARVVVHEDSAQGQGISPSLDDRASALDRASVASLGNRQALGAGNGERTGGVSTDETHAAVSIEVQVT